MTLLPVLDEQNLSTTFWIQRKCRVTKLSSGLSFSLTFWAVERSSVIKFHANFQLFRKVRQRYFMAFLAQHCLFIPVLSSFSLIEGESKPVSHFLQDATLSKQGSAIIFFGLILDDFQHCDFLQFLIQNTFFVIFPLRVFVICLICNPNVNVERMFNYN